MADNLPIKSNTRVLDKTATTSNSLLGRGLAAIQRQQTGIVKPDLDASYRQARDLYNQITEHGRSYRLRIDLLSKPSDLLEHPLLIQLQPLINLVQQLKDVFQTFQQLADAGYGKAYIPLTEMYFTGHGINKDYKKATYYGLLAFDWCSANQALNDSEIWTDFGCMFYDPNFIYYEIVQLDPERAWYWIRKAAEQCDALAQYELGNLYHGFISLYHGKERGEKPDYEQSISWYRKAAEQGNANAQDSLGWAYERGLGVAKDDEQAVFWYRKAAEQGDPGAQYQLGEMYTHGRGVKQDDEQAVFWYRKAAEQGHSESQYELGEMYTHGRGVKQDDEQAVFWYRVAAELDCLGMAQYKLGCMYDNGRVLKKDEEQAVFWYRKAAEQGWKEAEELLAARNISWTRQ